MNAVELEILQLLLDVRFGRPAIAKPQNWDTVVKQIDAKEISVSQALQALNISRSSYYRLR